MSLEMLEKTTFQINPLPKEIPTFPWLSESMQDNAKDTEQRRLKVIAVREEVEQKLQKMRAEVDLSSMKVPSATDRVATRAKLLQSELAFREIYEEYLGSVLLENRERYPALVEALTQARADVEADMTRIGFSVHFDRMKIRDENDRVRAAMAARDDFSGVQSNILEKRQQNASYLGWCKTQLVEMRDAVVSEV